MTWQTLRTLTAQVAEGTSAPTAETLVAVAETQRFTVDSGRLPYVEIALGALTFAGGVAATAVTFGVWRASEGKIDRVASIAVLAAEAAAPPQVVLDFHGEQIWLTVESFVGGTLPTVAGEVRVRPVRSSERRAAGDGSVGANIASTRSAIAPVAAPVAIARTDLTTVVTLAALPCTRGFWLSNPGSVRIYYALASGTAVTAAGANCTGFVEPGDRKWFGYSNANLLQVVSSSGTAQYCVDGE